MRVDALAQEKAGQLGYGVTALAVGGAFTGQGTPFGGLLGLGGFPRRDDALEQPVWCIGKGNVFWVMID